MRVLHVVEAFTGGVLTFLQALVNGLGEEWSSVILHGVRPDTPEEPEKLFRPGTALIRSGHLGRELDFGEDLAALREIRAWARALRPDVIHLHSSKAGALGRWAVSGGELPLFYTPHGYSFLMRGSGGARRALFYGIEKLCGLRNCTTIACGRSEYERSLRVARRAAQVNNGVDAESLDALFPKLPEGAPGVCTLARATRQKNPALFRRVAELLPDVHFTWIGDGELRGELTGPNIEVTGWLPREEALRRMAESRIFLLPSLWEGLPLALLEAMYLGRLCVASDIPGCTDAIRHGETGWLFRDAQDCAARIRALLRGDFDPGVPGAARARVAQEFSQGAMAARYRELYEEALKRRGREHG